MSSKPAVELDFFGLHRDNTTDSHVSSTSPKSQLRRLYDRQRSFREVQNAITKINPELLKASMAGLSTQDSGTSNCNVDIIDSNKSTSEPSSPHPGLRPAPAAAPLTIFYNGTVSVFDLPQDKAKTVLKFVEEGWFDICGGSKNVDYWVANMSKRRMLQRNVSLQRFLEKRKERLTAMPIHNMDGNQKNKENSSID